MRGSGVGSQESGKERAEGPLPYWVILTNGKDLASVRGRYQDGTRATVRSFASL